MLRFVFAIICAFSAISKRDISSLSEVKIEVGGSTIFESDMTIEEIFIANPRIADIHMQGSESIYIYGISEGYTTLFISKKGGKVAKKIPIHVTHNTHKIHEFIKDIVPDADVKATSVKDDIILKGSVNSIQDAVQIENVARAISKNVTNNITLNSTAQVCLKVKIAEVQRSAIKSLGINWSTLFDAGSMVFGLTRGRQFFKISDGKAIGFGVDAGNVDNNGNDSIFIQNKNGQYSINNMLDAMAEEGLATILAEPNLTTLSGQAASFVSGGEFPVQTVSGTGQSATTTTTFKEHGIKLNFTPFVLSENSIQINVSVEVSDVTYYGNNPGLNKRTAQTTVNMPSGTQFAIAGLIHNKRSARNKGMNGLSKLYLLGPLFRNSNFENYETEVVIIVTPYIVSPSQEKLSVPTDYVEVASHVEQILYNKLGKPKKRLIGSAGFMLDNK